MSVIGHNHIRKVETFDGYEILAHPLPKRDDRSFYPKDVDRQRSAVAPLLDATI